jgi:hypothetical protein
MRLQIRMLVRAGMGLDRVCIRLISWSFRNHRVSFWVGKSAEKKDGNITTGERRKQQ